MKACDECGKDNRRGGRLCASCYAARYRATPAGRAATRRAAQRWQQSHPDARARIAHAYRERSGGLQDPGLLALRRAVKALDAALADTALAPGPGGPGVDGRDDDPER